MSNELRQIMDDIGVLTGQLERISRSRRATGDVRAAALVQEAKEHSRFLATALGLALLALPREVVQVADAAGVGRPADVA